MWRQIEWGLLNGPITKNAVLLLTTLFSWKFCFSLRTFYKEFIWCTNYPIVHIHIFCKCWSFIWGCSSLWVSLKLILLQSLETISIWMCHVLWWQFCCSRMYTKTARNRSQLFKKTTWVIKLLCCLSACKCNDMQTDLIFRALLAYTSTILIHFLGNCVSVRLVDQQRRQMEVTFHSRCCIMGSGVGILTRKIRLALTFFNHKCACLGVSLNTLIFAGNCIFQQSTICKITKLSAHQAQSEWSF